jgi:hypothetical protein
MPVENLHHNPSSTVIHNALLHRYSLAQNIGAWPHQHQQRAATSHAHMHASRSKFRRWFDRRARCAASETTPPPGSIVPLRPEAHESISSSHHRQRDVCEFLFPRVASPSFPWLCKPPSGTRNRQPVIAAMSILAPCPGLASRTHQKPIAS